MFFTEYIEESLFCSTTRNADIMELLNTFQYKTMTVSEIFILKFKILSGFFSVKTDVHRYSLTRSCKTTVFVYWNTKTSYTGKHLHN